MKIRDVRITGLSGGTVDGGWPQGNKPAEDLNTIVEVITDEGLIGVGSVMTSKSLVESAVALMRPHLIGERADEPMRVTEKLRQSLFWQGRGGSVEHAISGIDIALWDLMGKVCKQPVARLLGGYYRHAHQTLRLHPLRRARPTAADPPADGRPRLQGDQAGLAALRPARPQDRRVADRDSPRDGRSRCRTDGRCRRQRAILAARLQMGPGNGQDAGRLRRGLVRGSPAAGRSGRLSSSCDDTLPCRSRPARC